MNNRNLLEPSRFQLSLLTVLTISAIVWLLIISGLKEYWGFWQSPEVYGFLKKEYPEWMRDYVRGWYQPVRLFTFTVFAAWLLLAARDLRTTEVPRVFYRRLGLILAVAGLMSAAIGLMCANNFIMWLDRGELHGDTHLQVREYR